MKISSVAKVKHRLLDNVMIILEWSKILVSNISLVATAVLISLWKMTASLLTMILVKSSIKEPISVRIRR